jgi:hypothetical protein
MGFLFQVKSQGVDAAASGRRDFSELWSSTAVDHLLKGKYGHEAPAIRHQHQGSSFTRSQRRWSGARDVHSRAVQDAPNQLGSQWSGVTSTVD